jgi:hypothetical protein
MIGLLMFKPVKLALFLTRAELLCGGDRPVQPCALKAGPGPAGRSPVRLGAGALGSGSRLVAERDAG